MSVAAGSAGAPRLTPRVREIVSTALGLLEEHGTEALTMRRLADQLGIRAPSLYKHLTSKAELEMAVIAIGFEDLAVTLEQAADGSGQRDGAGQRLTALGTAYREFALARPHLYRLMTERPLARELLPAGLEERAAAPLVRALGGDPDAARAAWAFAHGMIMLELNERFPPGADLDAAWRVGMERFGGLGSRSPHTGYAEPTQPLSAAGHGQAIRWPPSRDYQVR
jgi:AcrR family transcriptional regulator